MFRQKCVNFTHFFYYTPTNVSALSFGFLVIMEFHSK